MAEPAACFFLTACCLAPAQLRSFEARSGAIAAAETFELEEQTGEAGAEESCLAFNNSQLSDCLTFQ